MDVLTKEQRHRNMQAIHGRNTSIEISLRKSLWHKKVRYRIHDKSIEGRPDISIKRYKLAVFCDGDFWHGNCTDRIIRTNTKFWEQKIKRNRERDLEQTIRLRDKGWIVLRFWGSEILENPDRVADEIIQVINRIKKRKEKCRLLKEQSADNFVNKCSEKRLT